MKGRITKWRWMTGTQVLVILVLGTAEKEEIIGREMIIQVRLQRKIRVLHLSSATLLTLISDQRAHMVLVTARSKATRKFILVIH
jgi:hypothetical protein